ncbi:hypothetical protein SAMD00019534_009400 [Acytostelium subglobosum LB1]|uniref:hypothetical protein n=1 Tax=Acytostelium subglobosum LB1 TaxID=1410327 RepID=UPI000644C3E6|nr:hypothetical protein SAMD00019534_009400 [Acytostelium subglobosum LB1]GAM17765.1 hypothetical protein SAMD00019534_009400 [Acytostelium subglobosum LB1]|eukprot:XP_012758361.1 hypothetical protein SAMD00019534_009400 [Acytostelium subglobosum LB1]
MTMINSTDAFTVQNATVVRKQGSLLGLYADFAVMEVNLDRDLYINHAIACANYTSPTPLPEIDCTCDMASHDRCGQSASGHPSCNSTACTPTTNICTLDWSQVFANQTYHFNNVTELLLLRYKPTNKYVESTTFYFALEYGEPGVFLMGGGTGGRMGDSSMLSEIVFTICPQDSIWTNDTYHMTVFDTMKTVGFKSPFSLSLTIYSAPVNPVVTTAPKCTNISAAADSPKCINDGELIIGAGCEQRTFVVDRDMTFSFMCPMTGGSSIFIYIQDGRDASQEDNKWAYVNNAVDNWGSIVIGPWPNGTARILHIYTMPQGGCGFSYTCVFTSHAPLFRRPLTDNYPLAGVFNLQNSASIIATTMGGVVISSNNVRLPSFLSINFPMIYGDTFWPVPQPFRIQPNTGFTPYTYTRLRILATDNQPKNRTFQAAFRLGFSTFSSFVSVEDVAQFTLQFNSVLVDVDGKPLDNAVKLQLLDTPPCNYADYATFFEQVQRIEGNVTTETDFTQMYSYKFNLEMLAFRDAWVGCTQMSTNYLSLQNTTTIKETTDCPSPTDPKYANDPCCREGLQFAQCCVPRQLGLTRLDLTAVNQSTVNQQCSSPTCVTSVLNDYYSSTSLINDGDCRVPKITQTKEMDELIDTIRMCKESVYSDVYCQTDADCTRDQGKCILYSRKCMPKLEIQDRSYIKCIIDNAKASIIFNVLLQANMAKMTDNSTVLADKLYGVYAANDCVALSGNTFRQKYNIKNSVYCPKPYLQPSCLDQTCALQHDTCFDLLAPSWELQRAGSDSCSTHMCTSKGCLSSQMMCTNCTEEYCGHCTDNHSFCHNIKELNDTTSCSNSGAVCLLPNGLYNRTMTPDQCAQAGLCSQTCGYTCVGTYTGCYSTNFNSTTCAATSGATWSTAFTVCQFASMNQQDCSTNGHQWEDCATHGNSECLSKSLSSNSSNPYNIRGNNCQVQAKQCSSKAECEQASGSCSDQFYFDNKVLSSYPSGLGKCLRPHTNGTIGLVPSCLYNVVNPDKDSPRGCYASSPSVFRAADCPAGYTWWAQANNQQQCESQFGCLMPDLSTYAPDNQRRYNEMTESQCGGCDNSYKWGPMFKWTPGKWLPGVMVKPQWLSGAQVNFTTYQPALDFQAFSTSLMNGLQIETLRYESTCKVQRLQDQVNSIACSCRGPGGPQCFLSSSVPIKKVIACANETSSYQFITGILFFDEQSVAMSCNNLIVSQVTRQNFKSSKSVVSLSSDFVSYKPPIDYGITNSKGAYIGQVKNDGVEINPNGATHFTMCLSVEGDATSKEFPVSDFALLLDKQSSTFTPINAVITQRIINGTDYICSNISMTGTTAQTFFPVSRVSQWEDAKKRYFSNTDEALLFTLGTLFGVHALWGLFQLGFVMFTIVNRDEKPKLVHLLILSITIFISIRCIYFLALPSGTFYNSTIADYVLVVLPTFIYFTSFSIIMALWYVVIGINMQEGNYMQRLRRLIIIVNSVLYLLFVFIILVFNYTKNGSLVNNCKGRFIDTISNTRAQRIISIFYGVLQATISLLFGITFIYLGQRILKIIKGRTTRAKAQPDANATTTTGGNNFLTRWFTSTIQTKIFFVTVTCSIGLILHSVFVLALVSSQWSNVTFSFVGLIITEIIPVMTIFFAYNQGQVFSYIIQKRSGTSVAGSNKTNSRSASISDSSSTKMKQMSSTSSLSITQQ